MAGFIDRLLSGQYPKLESLWRGEFSRLADEFLASVDVPSADMDEQADIDRLEELLAREREHHEATKRELSVVKAELKSAQYQLAAVAAAVGSRRRWHDEPIG